MSATRNIRSAGIGAALLTLSLALGACSSDPGTSSDGTSGELNEWGGQTLAAGTAEAGGEFTFGIQAPVEDLDGASAVGASTQGPVRQIYGVLFSIDGDGQPAPELAESITSEDYVTWTLTLRDGLTFHDGTPFDAAAVKANIERVGAEGSRSLQASYARMVTGMEVVDPTTLKLTLAAPFAAFSTAFAEGSLAWVASPTATAAAGKQFGLKPVGAGPYQVESFSPGGDIVLTKFEEYGGPNPPSVDKIVYKVAPEAKSRVSAVSTGDLDGTALRTAADIQAAKDAGLVVLEQPAHTNYSLVLNLKDPVIGDVRIREALNRAVDREAFNSVVFGGKHSLMTGMLNDGNPYAVDADWPTYDQDKATALVEEVSAEQGGAIKLDMMQPGGPEMDRISALLQQMLADVGIELTYHTETPASMVAATMSSAFQIQLRESGLTPETLLRLESYFTAGSPFNSAGVTNDKVTALFAQSHTTGDLAERKQILTDIQAELAAWLPQVPIVSTTAAFVLGPDVVTFPGGIPSSTPEVFDASLVAVKQ